MKSTWIFKSSIWYWKWVHHTLNFIKGRSSFSSSLKLKNHLRVLLWSTCGLFSWHMIYVVGSRYLILLPFPWTETAAKSCSYWFLKNFLKILFLFPLKVLRKVQILLNEGSCSFWNFFSSSLKKGHCGLHSKKVRLDVFFWNLLRVIQEQNLSSFEIFFVDAIFCFWVIL